jgi:hypothetical protein
MTLRRTLVDFESVLFSIPVNSFYEATEISSRVVGWQFRKNRLGPSRSLISKKASAL